MRFNRTAAVEVHPCAKKNMFADLAKRNMAMFEDASRAFSGKGKGPSQAQAKPSGSDMDELRAELAALQAKVDKLGR